MNSSLRNWAINWLEKANQGVNNLNYKLSSKAVSMKLKKKAKKNKYSP